MSRAVAKPRGIWAAGAAAALLGLFAWAGCSVLPASEPILEQPDGLVVTRVSHLGKAEAPEPPEPLTSSQLVDSLRRITVRYHGAASFILRDPQPLLPVDQAIQFAGILATELPSLKPDQRVRFQFKDAARGDLNDLYVYREGAYLVYDFQLLVADPHLAPEPGQLPHSDASVEELPGQKVSTDNPRALIKDPVSGNLAATAAEASAKQRIIADAVSKKLIEEDEGSRLRTLSERNPKISTAAWQRYFDKRATLKNALGQGLMDRAAFSTQLERIERELVLPPDAGDAGATPQK